MTWKPTTEWEGKLKDITWSFGNEDVRFRHEQWRKVFEEQLKSTPFSIQAAEPLFSLPLGEESVEFTQWLSSDAIWDRYHTLSQFAVLEGQELADTKRRVLEATGAADVGKNENGELELHGRTYFAWSTAVPGAPLKSGG
ncbi:hypothetical protein HO133_008758 [Letharia lupina]|uniref:Uncharacterized protein n=1 Tax=Letharia lupina TaxID=560253 RepID=A0A8H6FGE3_9LECA|nr:uncharacterized protein HO133_008758 [Letharia lupina]KAF6227315.1 hypothetical protein HO133_008758 [Letharia lupina]